MDNEIDDKSNDINATDDCPYFDQNGEILLDNLAYYFEGITQTSFAFCGIIFNCVACIVLASKEMKNSFNHMLIALAIFDSGYLTGSILESFRKSFHLATSLHISLFPHLLFPGQTIMMSASIFMTVAIAIERYVAVHYPLNYNQVIYLFLFYFTRFAYFAVSPALKSQYCHHNQTIAMPIWLKNTFKYK